uniref:Uma2 family endonuclease n=1 Tax=Chroococcidiopsis sp. TS-821 TaxID=1378066 RepID=UPI001FED8588|nr:Uma2 family endonuclease [Chroococcidiopsis sp. TS-821]
MNAIILDLQPFLSLTDDQYYELCRKHPDLKLERNRAGQLIILPPTGGETGRKNSDINYQLVAWNKKKKLGVVFDSSTEFKLPLGSDRSPNAAWVKLERWRSLSDEAKKKFPPLCPDFIIELKSESDSLKDLRAKMQEYLKKGMALGWLVN